MLLLEDLRSQAMKPVKVISIFIVILILIGSITLSGCAQVMVEGEPASKKVKEATESPEEKSDVAETAKESDKTITVEDHLKIDEDYLSYKIVDTGQTICFDDLKQIECPEKGELFYGQDAQYSGNQPSYKNNGDGTVTDTVTGLMWQKDPGEKMTYEEALEGAGSFSLAEYDDWRLPTIKELYSLILFSGTDPSGPVMTESIPFIDTKYFSFDYGDESKGERLIDSQFISSTKYVSTTMNGAETVFGVNFADGRIKGYPTGPMMGQQDGKLFYVLYVRENPGYGINDFKDNEDGTITDSSTGLMWSKTDSGIGMTWEEALAWVEEKNSKEYLGYDDWRLPDAKELQSIVDYSKSPDTTGDAAIDSVFDISEIINEAGQSDYPFFWTSTTHLANDGRATSAVYISFGRAVGYMEEFGGWVDVHGAGAQRSDPKSGDPDDYPSYFGPQGDARRLFNYVRCVRDIDTA